MALTDALARLGSIVQRAANPVGQFEGLIAGGAGENLLRGLFPGAVSQPPKRTTRDFLLAYSTMPWLRAVVGKISWSVASVQWELYAGRAKPTKTHPQGRYIEIPEVTRCLRSGDWQKRRKLLKGLRDTGELTPILSNPMLDVLDSANPFQTGMQMRQVTQAHLELVGEAFYLKERNGVGAPVALWPLPPNWVLSTPTIDKRVFRVSWRGWNGEIPDTEILWQALPDPENPYGRGTGPAGALADELQTDEYISKHLSAFFYNRARPDLIVSAEGLDPTETKRMEQDWLNKHQGFWRAFKPYFFGRKITVTELDQDMRSQQLVQLRQHERDLIIHGWGVPPEVLGIVESSNRATISAADFLYANHILVPRLEFQRSIFQERLVPEYDARLILDYVNPVKEDDTFNLERKKAAPWAITVNEWREVQGYEGLPDGDVFMVPTLMKPVANLLDEAERASQPPPPNPFLPAPGAGNGNGTVPAVPGKAIKALSYRARAAVEKDALDRLAARLEPKLKAAFLDAIAAVKGAIDLEAVAAAVEVGDPAAVDVAMRLLDMDGKLSSLKPVISQAFTRAGEIAAGQMAEAGLEIAFDVANPRAAAWAETYGSKLVVEITEAQRATIRALVTSGQMAEGETVYTIARQLRDVVGLTERQAGAVERFRQDLLDSGVAVSKVDLRVARYADAQLKQRGETIARTEVQTASYQGQLEAWQQGVDAGQLEAARTFRVWIVHDDDRLDREICEPMDEQRQKFEKPFKTGDGRTLMVPPAHPRCRCSVVLDFAP